VITAGELRDLDFGELKTKSIDMREEFFNLRFQHGVGQLENTAQLKSIRRDIARVKTIINEQIEKDKE